MKRLAQPRFAGLLMHGLVLVTLHLAAFASNGAEVGGRLDLMVQLIWGTNGEKPAEPKDIKVVEPDTSKRLSSVFKWKNYFEVTRKNANVAVKATQRIVLSDKCVVEIDNLGDSLVEVRVVGEGKNFSKTRESIAPGKVITIGGEDKNSTAWFVVVTRR